MDLVAGDMATGENTVVVGEAAMGDAEGIESLNIFCQMVNHSCSFKLRNLREGKLMQFLLCRGLVASSEPSFELTLDSNKLEGGYRARQHPRVTNKLIQISWILWQN